MCKENTLGQYKGVLYVNPEEWIRFQHKEIEEEEGISGKTWVSTCSFSLPGALPLLFLFLFAPKIISPWNNSD